MARILYVSTIWGGLDGPLLEGGPPKGQPAFVKPLRMLLQRGHVVDYVWGVQAPMVFKPNPVVFGGGQMYQVLWPWVPRGLPVLRAAVRLKARLGTLLAGKKYDFVYGHGQYAGAIANLAANHHNVPFGLRGYGSALPAQLDRVRQVGSLRKPFRLWDLGLPALLEALDFRLRKRFFIVTNDGSKADSIYRVLGCRRYEWFFWRNGVDFPSAPGKEYDLARFGLDRECLFMVYPANILSWKRQDRVLEILGKLKQRPAPALRVIFAGQRHQSSGPYFDKLSKLAESLGVANQVCFAGSLTMEELLSLYRQPNCLCVGALYDYCNLGNAVLEAFAAGAIVLSLRNTGLDWLIQTGDDGFLVDNLEEACDALSRLAANPDLRDSVRAAAAKTARQKLETWATRCDREVRLIENALGA